MAEYTYEGAIFNGDTEDAQAILRRAHAAKRRPHCRCVPGDGPPMYVAKVGERFFLKRMPGSGSEHAPRCDSFDPPAELTGLGDVLGSAIQDDPETGTTALRLDFALRKSAGRAAPAPGTGESDTVRTDGQKLTLRALLHYLWDESGLTRWTPAMQDTRTYRVVYRELLKAAANKATKGLHLTDRLFVPEPFSADHKDEIASRRTARLASSSTAAGRDLFILIGEVKELVPSRTAFKAVIKHLPDYPILIAEDLNRRLQKRFASELDMWNSIEEARLIAIATFSVGPSGVATMEEVAVMLVNNQWLPCESRDEKTMLDLLIRERRRFKKGLRYNLSLQRPLASVVLADAGPEPVAMFIVPPNADGDYRAALADLQQSSHTPTWIWETSEGPHQAIPAKVAS
jgi:hypothetical protein